MSASPIPQKIQSLRRYLHGAELAEGGVSFRLYAPERKAVTLVIDGGDEYPLARDGDGYFSVVVPDAAAGTRYRYRLDDTDELLADPAAHFQPDGLDGPSEVIDPDYAWHDSAWKGLRATGNVLYEMHVGTFTPEGTYRAAEAKLSHLRDLGVTAIEMMPLAQYAGEFGWGYDGAIHYAPAHQYGRPDDLRHFVDAAHKAGIGVILDVVYNHFGAGDRMHDFSKRYFSDERPANEWGDPLSFKDRGVREYYVGNALYWLEAFHVDGFRFDAVQAIEDDSEEHILAEIIRRCREAAGDRSLYMTGEDEPQDARMVRHGGEGALGLDSLWNDDFHHAALVAVTGRSDAYYHDYKGAPQELISTAKYGYLFQGQRSHWAGMGRGKPGLDLPPAAFVHYLENHDQLANSARGDRLSQRVGPGRMRALTGLFLLMPQTPMLFQGQEFASSRPFVYFADQKPELAPKVKEGREYFLTQFQSLRDQQAVDALAVPHEEQSFTGCKLDWSEVEANAAVLRLHRELLAMRRDEPAFANPTKIDGAVISEDAFILRFFAERGEDERLMIVNFGRDLPIYRLAEPLAAPPAGLEWRLMWSSEAAIYGGDGRRPVDMMEPWSLSSDTTLVFGTGPARDYEWPGKDAGEARQRGLIF